MRRARTGGEWSASAGDTMVVIGAGPIGLMFMHVAELAGVKVIAVVKREDQIAAAKLFGASRSCRSELWRTWWQRLAP